MEIIQNFCDTFDIRYYEQLDDDTKEFFRQASELVLKLRRANLPLAQVVRNYYKIMPPVDYLKGAVNFEMLKRNNMNVLLIGDFHSPTTDVDCKGKFPNSMSVPKFLRQLVENEPFLFDLFSETTFVPDLLFPVRGSALIHSTNEEFKDCFVPKLRNKSSNIRCHLTDFRGKLSSTKFKNLMKKLPDTNPFKVFLTANKKEAGRNFRVFLETNITLEDYRQVQELLIPEVKKIRKQLEDEDISGEIIDTSWEVYIEYELEKLKKIYNENQDRTHEKNAEFVRNTLMRAPLLDYYTLGRIFRTFEKKSYRPDIISNIIIVAGIKHNELNKRILQSRGFRSVYLSEEENDRKKCLDIRGFNYRQLALS